MLNQVGFLIVAIVITERAITQVIVPFLYGIIAVDAKELIFNGRFKICHYLKSTFENL